MANAPTETHPVERVLRIDVTDDTRLAAAIDAIDAPTRERLSRALADHIAGEHEQRLIELVRETLTEDAADYPDLYTRDNPPVGVLFTADNSDDGYYFDDNATVLFRNGATTDVQFPVEPELRGAFGRVGPDYTLSLDLRTETFDIDEYGTNRTIHQEFRISEPCPAYRPDDPATLAWWRDYGGLPDDLTIDGQTFPDAGHAIGYLTLKRMPAEQVLYLANSDAQRLADRKDQVYRSVATATTKPTWVTTMAARVAFANAWVDADEYARITAD